RRFVSDGECHRRLQQQEPSCPRRRATRHHLHLGSDDLRPAPPSSPRADRSHPEFEHLLPHTPRPPRGTLLHIYTQVHDRLLTPLLGADTPPAPLPLRRALHTIDQHVDSYIDHARLRLAA